MKKFMFLFLVVAFVAVMAGGAMACVPPCYDCDGEDDLIVNYSVFGVTCFEIKETSVSGVETFIGCNPYDYCWGDPVEFHWGVVALGICPRTMTLSTSSIPPGVAFEVALHWIGADPTWERLTGSSLSATWPSPWNNNESWTDDDNGNCILEDCELTRRALVRVGANSLASVVCNQPITLSFLHEDQCCAPAP